MPDSPLLPDDRPLAPFFGLQGRIDRRTFWLCFAAIVGLSLYFRAVLGIARMRPEMIEGVVNLLAMWPLLALSAKRWHDRDRSGWWALVLLIPVIGWLWMLIANGVLRGTPGANRYGPEPAAAASR
jgi:uncharacterized membrane protein YhaH (DUF805 family)